MPTAILRILMSTGACAAVGLAILGATFPAPEFDPEALGRSQEPGPPDGFGPPPGGPGGFGPGGFMAGMLLEEADADRDGRLSPEEAGKAAAKFVAEADKKGSLDAQALGRALNRRMSGPPGMPAPDDPDFGPGTFFGPMLLEAADADKDGRLTPKEAGAAAVRFVRQGDADKKGSLDAEALAAAVNSSLPGPPGFGPGGPGGRGGPMGGPGGPMGGGERKLVKKYDKDGDGRLNGDERQAAVAGEKSQPGGRGGPGGRRGPGFGPPGFGGGEQGPASPGAKVAKSEVVTFPGKPLYDPGVLRTLFLDFEDDAWESQMAAFYKSDVEVPATLTVDGGVIPGVGVHFRGQSSYFSVPEGRKRSLNVSVDFTDPDRRLEGYKTLNLLNAHEDATFLHTVLYSTIARRYIPAPKANFVRVVINGENWGVYANVQQFDKKFLAENYGTEEGARWKVPGNPGADGGLGYHGEDLAPYKQRYELKSSKKGEDVAWTALVALCRTLDETPTDRLEKALEPILDVDGVLRFLALDNALINGDGYWTRASDYSIYLDPKGKFHVVPHDMNEAFQPAMMFGGPGGPGGFGRRGGGRGGPQGGGPGFGPGGGPGGPPGRGPGGGPPGGGPDFAGGPPPGGGPGFGPGGPGGPGGPPGGGPGRPGGPGGPGGGNVELDPLIGLDAAGGTRTPLRSKLLAVPELKAKYLGYVKAIAEKDLDWKTLGPVVQKFKDLIDVEIEADAKKLSTYAAYQAATSSQPGAEGPAAKGPQRGRGPGGGGMNLRAFADARRKFLLGLPAVQKAEYR
ncbi:CotH kinase family protein [Paludisphaera mucosa]|uniref:CotH kinase family protein n=1 Tax=Paludisphaera mucosa TaxID=3030827 RepID=A0ABT6FAS1_9BACT|nr:CotH kinase family protein [Paludisphaera mucosa]MDG3004664.1 CotH kinase family protein [Paludisphaera mucosa]